MEADQGYFVYKNFKTGEEAFDHPKLMAVMSHLEVSFAAYKYTVYRCAMKLITLQKVLFTSTVPYKLVLSILDRHHLSKADDTIPIHPKQLTSIIHDIFFACEKMGHYKETSSFELDSAVEVLANFIWNIFDSNRTGPVSLREIKGIFLILCEISTREQMISEYFLLAADYNRLISRFRLENLLRIVARILSFIGESESYGSHVVIEIIDQCFAQCPGINGINEYQFNCLWTTSQTKFLIYANLLALVKRIKETEKLVHHSQCASCYTEKIVGIRFKCQICRNLSLCMKCFAVGFTNKKHRNAHRMYEVFTEDIPHRKWTHYIAKMCNVFLVGRQQFPQSYETRDDDEIGTELTNLDTKLVEPTAERRCSIRQPENTFGQSINSNVSYIEKFQTIIERLLFENSKIEKQKQFLLQRGEQDICTFLDSHKEVIRSIVEQLNFLMSSKFQKYPTSSTPNRLHTSTELSEFSSNLSHSINGADINKSYLEANKSDYSISDLSTWFHPKRSGGGTNLEKLSIVAEDECSDTQMTNFKDLLTKVKEIVDDSYSDNFQLAEATHNLEIVLDSIIESEEYRRRKLL